MNTKPLVFGLEEMRDEIDLIFDYPSRVAGMLMADEIDVGLVPVSIIPRLNTYQIVTDYCIGAEGPVASVCLFSDVPMEEVETVLLDYQSRTSVALAKLLLRDYWKVKPALVDAEEDYRKEIQGRTAGLVIGDRAFEQRKTSRFIYDLAEAWVDHTNLPFVFAAWVTNKDLDPAFTHRFNQANRKGLEQLDVIIRQNHSPFFDLGIYYTRNISYHLSRQKKAGLNYFISLLKTL